MRKTTLFTVVAATLIVTGFGLWAAAPAKAPASPSMGQGIDPHQLMVNAKGLSRAEFVDYTFVFH